MEWISGPGKTTTEVEKRNISIKPTSKILSIFECGTLGGKHPQVKWIIYHHLLEYIPDQI